MLAIVKSVTLTGMEGHLVMVEVDVSNGLPSFNIVGLPDSAVREATERVRTAIRNSGFDFPVKRITVNLAPADIRKEGPVFDLAIAVGILAASKQITSDKLSDYVFLGELSLDGTIKYIHGILPSVLLAREKGENNVVVSSDNGPEGALARDINIYALPDLKAVVSLLGGEVHYVPLAHSCDYGFREFACTPDLSDVRGQSMAKRALEISAAGGHNILLIGPPGSGKTMLAERLIGLMPALEWQEAIEVTKVYSIAGLLKPAEPLINKRPFRAPHHNASRQSLIGGGRIPKPGEITLSNHGVLFLDEMPEFSKDCLEALRQPLEDRTVTITRVQAAHTYPAKIILIAAMNPCPCGYYGSNIKDCQCTPVQIKNYLNRISGPLLDRIDLHVEVPAIRYNELVQQGQIETSEMVKNKVVKARGRQKERFSGPVCNAEMNPGAIKEYCSLGQKAALLLKEAFNSLALSARAYHRILKISRTIADLEDSKDIREEHIAEAIQYRTMDRKFWY